MNKTPVILLIVSLCTALVYFSLKPDAATPPTDVVVFMPWDIKTHPDGTSTVFNLRLEHSTVADTLSTLGRDHDLAIISDQNNPSGLEIYYSHFTAGPIKGKLVIAVKATQTALEQMQIRADSISYTTSGARKFLISQDDLIQIQSWPIVGLSFIPSANLDEEIIKTRFGIASEIIDTGEGEIHFLFPQKGLDITLNEETKEVLQYVAPRSFSNLKQPLSNHSKAGEIKGKP